MRPTRNSQVCFFSIVLLTLTAPSTAHAQRQVPDLTHELEVSREILSTGEIQNAFAYVDRAEEETVQEWLSICNTYGPSGDEIYRSRQIFKLFRIYGLEDVRIDDLRNVIGVRKGVGDGSTVVLNAHHDNTGLWPKEQPIEAFVADGRVWCPAAGDDLGGVIQMLTVLRAMNAANIETEGDVWFATFTGEEPAREHASPGAEFFARSNYPHNIDWRNGDILVQMHNGGGAGVSTGSTPVRHRTQLRVFVPFDWQRWGPHAIDALGPLIERLTELRDPRVSGPGTQPRGSNDPTLLFFNMPMVEASEIINSPAKEVRIRFDLRSPSEQRIWQAHNDIQRIAADVCTGLGEGYSYVYEITSKNGVGIDVAENAFEGWDKVDNAPARMIAAASNVLYGTEPVIDPDNGCGDCVRSYLEGMPAFSLRGNVLDLGGGRFETSARRPLQSEVRRMSVGHDVTESADIQRIWAGVKHALLFTVSYAGLRR
jgi:acetylornithine deacetylase/succinyl-diaminopimelate desuccinylase-like protein